MRAVDRCPPCHRQRDLVPKSCELALHSCTGGAAEIAHDMSKASQIRRVIIPVARCWKDSEIRCITGQGSAGLSLSISHCKLRQALACTSLWIIPFLVVFAEQKKVMENMHRFMGEEKRKLTDMQRKSKGTRGVCKAKADALWIPVTLQDQKFRMGKLHTENLQGLPSTYIYRTETPLTWVRQSCFLVGLAHSKCISEPHSIVHTSTVNTLCHHPKRKNKPPWQIALCKTDVL